MKAIINKSFLILENLKDALYIGYFIAMITLTFVFLMEAKIYFSIDVIPGMDIPFDEWYADNFKLL